jgi:hypothetical protein
MAMAWTARVTNDEGSLYSACGAESAFPTLAEAEAFIHGWGGWGSVDTLDGARYYYAPGFTPSLRPNFVDCVELVTWAERMIRYAY